LNQLKVKANERAKDEMICCFEIIQAINDYIEDNKDKIDINHNNDDDDNNKSDIDNNDRISRTFIYFHHIKSSQKKKEIIDNANELEIYGIWKEGFPGLILCEGIKINIEEYVRLNPDLAAFYRSTTIADLWAVSQCQAFVGPLDTSEMSRTAYYLQIARTNLLTPCFVVGNNLKLSNASFSDLT
jgi:hypothetical protein